MMQAEYHSSDVKMVSFFHPEGIEKVDSIGFKIAHEYISGWWFQLVNILLIYVNICIVIKWLMIRDG